MRIKQLIPALDWGATYDAATFKSDLAAGITVGVMLVPQGMAYALLAGMPPIYGLYGGLIPLALYAILGTSRQLSIGPVAISALLILAGVSQLAEPGTERYIQLVILAGLLIGIAQLGLSILQMGFLVNFLSHPVVAGFTSAAAVIIAVSQLKDLLGFDIPRFAHTYETVVYAFEHLQQTNWISVAICLGAITLMTVLRKIDRNIPGALIAVAIGILMTWFFNLQDQGLRIVRDVPQGLPSCSLPAITWDNIRILIPTVLTVTIIGIIESIGIAKVLETKHRNYVVRPNQELLALGLSKIGGAFFQALPTSGSFTRSAINHESGAKTGMASIITVTLIAFTLLFLTPLFYYLPKAVLAAIILLAVRSLFDLPEAIHLWKNHKQDFLMMMATFIFTLFASTEEGVLLGVVLSVLAMLYRSSKPHIAVLGNLPGTNHYRNINRFAEADNPDDLLIIRFDSQLYFGNAAYYKEKIRDLAVEKLATLKVVVLDFSSIHELDSTGQQALEETHLLLSERGLKVLYSGVIGPVRDILSKSGLTDKIGKNNFFMYVHDAIRYINNQRDGMGDLGWTSHAIQSNI